MVGDSYGNTKNIRNNLFVNNRTGSTANKQSAIQLAGTTGITIDYNDDHTDYVILPANPDDERAKGIARKLTSARSIYKELAQKMGSARSDVTGRSWTDGQILEMCHLIDAVIYPVAISEELLDMRETLEDFASQFKAAPPADDISEQ